MTNSGSTAVDGVVMSDIFSTNPDFSFDGYSSVAAGGATGNTSNNGGVFNDINDTLDLPPGSSVTYTVDVALNDAAYENDFFTNTATLTPPAGTTLTPSSNLTATDTTDIFCGE